MFLHVSVILFTGGGWSALLHAGIPPRPEAGTSPGTRPPRSRQPPPQEQRQASPPGTGTPPPHSAQCMLGDTDNKREVRILLECSLVQLVSSCNTKTIQVLTVPNFVFSDRKHLFQLEIKFMMMTSPRGKKQSTQPEHLSNNAFSHCSLCVGFFLRRQDHTGRETLNITKSLFIHLLGVWDVEYLEYRLKSSRHREELE